MQNENGPCPLLAAANALLLRGVITLPPASIRTGVASINDVVNMLAERALKQSGYEHVSSEEGEGERKGEGTGKKFVSENNSSREYQINELLSIFPSLQYGMDVNPKFLAGPTGAEYTKNLTAFDLMGVELVHGWLLDPLDEGVSSVIGNKTYNELIEVVVRGSEATSEIEKLRVLIQEKQSQLQDLKEKKNSLTLQKAEEEGDSASDPEWVNVPSISKKIEETVIAEDTILPSRSEKSKEREDEKSTESKELEQSHRSSDEKGEDDVVADPLCSEAASEANDDIIVNPPCVDASSETGDDIDDKCETLASEITRLQKEIEENNICLTNSSIIDSFLKDTSHQLTYTGLTELHNYVKEEHLCVFFPEQSFCDNDKT
jgi:hypothetical protein